MPSYHIISTFYRIFCFLSLSVTQKKSTYFECFVTLPWFQILTQISCSDDPHVTSITSSPLFLCPSLTVSHTKTKTKASELSCNFTSSAHFTSDNSTWIASTTWPDLLRNLTANLQCGVLSLSLCSFLFFSFLSSLFLLSPPFLSMQRNNHSHQIRISSLPPWLPLRLRSFSR